MATSPSRNVIYSDLDLNFKVHPNNKKLLSLKDDNAIFRALKNLLFTNFYERPFHPEIGSNLKALLFENISPGTARNIRDAITEAIDNFEPRVQINSLFIDALPDENRYNVQLEYFVINDSAPKSVNFFLERIR